eukprot:TRINITY_DN39490_c0_g1_i1.p1 TRINITY_DN39490_c0_g1~~TRINITY_DN39490_c0_g1_i1.p1  ORF type:complete len:1089 (+),score=363.90 TRINITY_DN39490_c0_g1_i1:44-3310(+)
MAAPGMGGGPCPVELSRVYHQDRTQGKTDFVCCATGYDGRRALLFVGREDGQVLVFSFVPPTEVWPLHYDLGSGWADRTHAPEKPCRLVKVCGVAAVKKPILQMEMDSENRKLFVLSDGTVKMFAWKDPDLKLNDQTREEKSKQLTKATCFCISKKTERHHVCVFAEGRAHLFDYRGGEQDGFSPYTGSQYTGSDRPLLVDSDVVQCAWFGNLLCLLGRDRCRVVDVESGMSWYECAGGGAAVMLEELVSLPPGNLTDDAEMDFHSDLMVQQGDGQSHFCKSGGGKAFDTAWFPAKLAGGKSRGKDRGKYLMGFCGRQYLIGVTDEGVCAHSFLHGQHYKVPLARSGKPSHGTHDPFIAVASCDTHVYMLTTDEVHVVTIVPYQRQVANLAARESPGRDQIGAEALLRRTFPGGLLPVEEQDRREDLPVRLAHMYKHAGFHHYERGNFETAFDCFRRSWRADWTYFDVRQVLALFKLPCGTSIIRAFEEYFRDVETPECRTFHEVIQSKDLVDRRAELTTTAQRCLFEYLKDVREPPIHSGKDLDVEEEEDDEDASPYQVQYRAIDTVLLFMYVSMDSGLDLESDDTIQRIMCNVEYDVCEPKLRQRGHDRFLALLMLYNNQVDQALEKLREIGAGDGEEGVQETVLALKYCSRSERDNERVLRYLPWILEKNPDDAIEALLVCRDPPLPPKSVMRLIEDLPDDLVEKYLEHIIGKEGNKDPEYHTQLALILIRSVLLLLPLTYVADKPLTLRAGQEAGLLGQMRQRLIDFLHKSVHYRAGEVLAHLYNTKLHEELVAVYSRTEEHDAALRVLLYEMDDPEKAQEHCERQFRIATEKHLQAHRRSVSATDESGELGGLMPADGDWADSGDAVGQSSFGGGGAADGKAVGSGHQSLYELFAENRVPISDSRGNVFVGIGKHNTYLHDLISLCLHPDRGEAAERHPRISLALELLQKHSTSLDPRQVLRLMPAESLSVGVMAPYLRQVFCRIVAQKHQGRIRERLAEMNETKHKFDRGVMQHRSIVVHSDRRCDICKKRIGEGSVFCVFPNLRVAHYRCVQHKDRDPTTQRPFRVDLDGVHSRAKRELAG